MRTNRPAGLAVLLAAALGVAGCGAAGTATPSPNLTATPTPTVASPSAGSTSNVMSPHNDVDVAFATGMVPHHQQAVAMSDMLLSKTSVDDQTRTLAETVKAAQAPEIITMTGWLQAWGVPSPSAHEMGSDDGMMAPAEMDALAAAGGAKARRLFLTGMITHHQGAVAMAQTELAQGANPDAQALARSIVASQSAEIATMRRLLVR